MIAQRDWRTEYQFPVGKARLEPIGVLVFSVIMIVSFVQVCVESLDRLLTGAENHTIVVLSLQSIIIMMSTGMNPREKRDGSCGETWMLVMV